MPSSLVCYAPSCFALPSSAAEWQTDWEKTLAAAKKEGTVVVGIPASSELRTAISAQVQRKVRYSGRAVVGPRAGERHAHHHGIQRGVRYFDMLVAGGATPLSMVAAGAADDFQSYMILPEVKDPKNWWGGHIWEDNVSSKRHVYAFLCYTSETLWYNGSQVEPSEIRSFDDLLNPKWKGRIGFLDPRNPGSGQNTWSFLWKVKGEEFLQQARAAGSADQSKLAPARRCPWRKASSRSRSASAITATIPSSKRACR